jgi:hypothetical protein
LIAEPVGHSTCRSHRLWLKPQADRFKPVQTGLSRRGCPKRRKKQPLLTNLIGYLEKQKK